MLQPQMPNMFRIVNQQQYDFRAKRDIVKHLFDLQMASTKRQRKRKKVNRNLSDFIAYRQLMAVSKYLAGKMCGRHVFRFIGFYRFPDAAPLP